MYCALCKREIKGSFTDPKSHRKGCPIYVDTESVAKVIVKEAGKPPSGGSK